VSDPLEIAVSRLAAGQIRAAEEWWRINRLKAPNAIREDLDRASALIAIQPEVGARARNVVLSGVRRLHLLESATICTTVSLTHQDALRSWLSGIRAAGVALRFED